jgi:FMN reductase
MSRKLGLIAHERLQSKGVQTTFLNMRDITIPFCDAGSAYGAPDLPKLKKAAQACTHAIFAVPIYNYDVNSVAKNVIELAGRDFSHKTLGFICSAGGQGSYMSIMPFANSMMLDFRCWIVPRFVYSTDDDWDNEQIKPHLSDRIDELLHVLCAHVPPPQLPKKS